MEKYSRSKSSRDQDGGVKQEPKSMHDLRSYSTSYCNIPSQNINSNLDYYSNEKSNKDYVKKMKNSSSTKNWNMNMDPELLRKKRVAGYKAYGVEGKMKSSFRTSFKWIKATCNHVVHGLW